MPEDPHKIFDRSESIGHVREHFSDQQELLGQLANYGSNLVIRAFESSPKGIGDIFACYVHLKQIVTMVDSVEILLGAGAIHAAHLPARAAFEASLYLEWMLVSDLETKAKYYYVANLRSEKLWATRAIAGTPESQKFKLSIAQLGTDLLSLRPEIENEAKILFAEVDRILGQQDLADVNMEFDKARGKRNFNPKWYQPLGVTSIRNMAVTLRRLPEYDIFYAKGSNITHSGSYKDHIAFSKGRVRLKNIRHLEGISALLNFMISMTLKSYEMVLKYYRQGELESFSRRYIEEWRKPLMSIKGVRYTS